MASPPADPSKDSRRISTTPPVKLSSTGGTCASRLLCPFVHTSSGGGQHVGRRWLDARRTVQTRRHVALMRRSLLAGPAYLWSPCSGRQGNDPDGAVKMHYHGDSSPTAWRLESNRAADPGAPGAGCLPGRQSGRDRCLHRRPSLLARSRREDRAMRSGTGEGTASLALEAESRRSR